MSFCAGPAGHEDHAHAALAQLLLNVCYSLELDRLQVQAPAHVTGRIRVPLSTATRPDNKHVDNMQLDTNFKT